MEPNHLRKRIIGTCTDGFYCKSNLLLQLEFLARFLGSVCGLVTVEGGGNYYITAQAGKCGIIANSVCTQL